MTVRICIIGAGLAGTFVARSLAMSARGPITVDLIDSTGTFGPGLAYATDDLQHLLNVPAARASADPADPEHFVAWARRADQRIEPGSFVPRRTYGGYLSAQVDVAERAITDTGGTFTRRAMAAVDIEQLTTGAQRVTFDDGATRDYDHVVLALGNLAGPPVFPLPEHPRIHPTGWHGAAHGSDLDAAEPGELLLIGTGLTAVDVALSRADDPAITRIVAVSRTGQLPFAHLPGPLRTAAPAPPLPPQPTTLAATEQHLRAYVAEQERAGFDWRDAVDGIRHSVQQFWAALPLAEQRAFIGTRMRAWEIRRHRMAPQIAARIAQLCADGRLEIVTARVDRVEVDGGSLAAHLSGESGARTLHPREIVACTGTIPDVTRTTNSLVQALLRSGVLAPDAHQLGVQVTRSEPSTLHTIGALRRGELWETTGIGEIRAQAGELAEALLRDVAWKPQVESV